MPVIERYFSSDDDLARVGNDFRNLIGAVSQSYANSPSSCDTTTSTYISEVTASHGSHP